MRTIILNIILLTSMLVTAQIDNTIGNTFTTGNLQIKIDNALQSLTITKQGDTILYIDECSSMCDLRFATTYEVKYTGYALSFGSR